MNPNLPPVCNGLICIIGGACALFIAYKFLSGLGDTMYNRGVDKAMKRIPRNGYAESIESYLPSSRNDVIVSQMEIYWPGHGNGPNYNVSGGGWPTLDVYIRTAGDQFTKEAFNFARPQGTTRTHMGHGLWRYEVALNEPVPPGENAADWKRMEAREWAQAFGFDPYNNYLPESGTPDDMFTGRYGT